MGSHTISMMLHLTVPTLLTVMTYVISVPLSGPIYGNHFEGDIAIRDPEKFAKTGILRAFVKNKELRWSRTIQYTIGSDLDDYRTIIQECLQWIQDHSCLVFIEGTTGDHIKFTSFGDNENSGQGCWSYFGRRGGEQVVNLEIPSCLTKDTIYHEIFHALGKVHEQSRPDRDDYVEILLENVQGGEEHQFEIKKNVDTANTHYDLASIMHYGPHAFSYNGEATIKSKYGESFGDTQEPTATDLWELNHAYGCKTQEVETSSEISPEIEISSETSETGEPVYYYLSDYEDYSNIYSDYFDFGTETGFDEEHSFNSTVGFLHVIYES